MRLRTNTAALLASFVGTAVLVVLQFKIISLNMDQAAVGVWSMLFASGAMLGTLSELGLPVVLLRFGARFDAVGNPGRLKALLRFTWIMWATAFAVIVAAVYFSGESFGARYPEGGVSRNLLLLAYVALASGSMRALNNAAFKSLRTMIWIPILEVLFALLMTVSVFVLRHQLTISLLFVLFLAASVLVGAMGTAVLLSKIRKLPGEHKQTGSLVREIRAYWLGAALSGVFIIAMERLDKLAVGVLIGAAAVASYEAATRLAMFAKRMLGQPTQVLLPEITNKWETGRGQELLADIKLFIKLQVGLGLFLVIPMCVFAFALIRIISDEGYGDGAPAVWAFCLSIPILCLYHPLVTMLKATGHIWPAFASEALWVVIYLGVGGVLASKWGLTGLASGQVVASICMLLYTWYVFYRLRLPCPNWGFYARLSAMILALWIPAWILGRTQGMQMSLFEVGAWSVVICVVLNALLVWGGFLNNLEQQRVISLLAGKGILGSIARFGFRWPKALFPGAGVLALLIFAAWLSGCSQTLEHGCSCNDQVPKKIRTEIERAADELFARIEAQETEVIFENAASPVVEKSNAYDFVEPMALSVARFGLPKERTTHKLYAIHFKRGHAIEFPVPCGCDGEEVDRLMLRRHPTQVSLVQYAGFGPLTVQYSILFWLEDDQWKVGGFVARPVQVYGRDWKGFEDWADEQMQKGNLRNAALLMNVALDLLVPNSWTRPESVERIETKQNSLLVTNLPANMLDVWSAPNRDFRVYKVEKLYGPQALDVGFHYETYEAVADTVLIAEMHEELFGYIQTAFPEYSEVFDHAVIRATEAGNIRDKGFTRAYKFGSSD